MTTKDLIFAANILLDCEEMSRDNAVPLLDYIRDKCKQYNIPEVTDDLIKIVTRCGPVYNTGTVTYDFNAESHT